MTGSIKKLGKWVLLAALVWGSPVMGSGKIDRMQVVGSTIELTVQTTPGARYQLQSRSCLCEGEWGNEGPEFVADASQEVRTVAIISASCSFRVVKVDSGSGALPSGPTPPGAPPSVPSFRPVM